MQIGPWVCGEQIGRGGNGAVFRARRGGDGEEIALKVVKSTKAHSEPYRRFTREIEFLQTIGDFPGVLPVVDAYLPKQPSRADRPWLAMPIATPIAFALADATLETVVTAVAALADTLARLSEEHQVGHRDIKPGNLYELDGEFLVGDFGLIDIPDLDELTRSGKPLGPANFTAYEVVRDPVNAASGPADVFSLGKTLWALATGVNWPPLGHQPADSRGHAIGDYRPHGHARHLDRLIDRMTRLDADQRPTMREVASDLEAWLRLASTPVAVDVSSFRGALHAKLGAEIAAQHLQAERKQLALRALRGLQERMRPLNDALRELHPGAQIDGTDRLTENVLATRHALGTPEIVFSHFRCSSIATGEISPYALRVGRGFELASDGTLLGHWMLDVGPVRTSRTDMHVVGRDYEAPVGSIEQEQMLDRFVADLSARLGDAVAILVEKAPADAR
jgi:hypothetical protein